MKKIVFALALVFAAGSFATAVQAATTGVKIEKSDDKKDESRKEKKRKKKEAATKGCSKESGKSGCCSKKAS